MTTITTLQVRDFRNLRALTLECSPGLNLILGANGCGKTSLLEALYYLGRARSFRTHQVRELVHHGAEAFRLVAATEADGRRVTVGIERSAREQTVRIGGASAKGLAELALQVPVLLLNPGSHRLLEEGPCQRRRFMDWGLFYAEGDFWEAWRQYTGALRQRNAALRASMADRDVGVWENQLAASAGLLDVLRGVYCEALAELLAPRVEKLLGPRTVTVDYRRGWGRDQDLLEQLRRGREQDRRLGFTRPGPHRADFVVKLDGRPSDYLSRGQQKLLIIALVLAQAELYRRRRGGPCVLLIDDLPSELDRCHRDRVMGVLADSGAQTFVSAIEADHLDATAWSRQAVFHLDGGVLIDTPKVL